MNKQTKSNNVNGFSLDLIRSWEESDGVNFAIALSKISGWLLQVDWLTPSNEEKDVQNMKSLRVYVQDNTDNIFDCGRKQKLTSFANKTIMPIVKNRGNGKGGVLTRYYNEEKIFSLPLRVKPNIDKIKIAEIAIRNNPSYLEKIPQRTPPYIPAYVAAGYTYGKCAVYAQAIQDLKGLKAVAIIANKYTEQFEASKLGYVHSVNKHNDNFWDVWGEQKIEEIAARFNLVNYTLSEEEHIKVVGKLKANSPPQYEEIYKEATGLIQQYY